MSDSMKIPVPNNENDRLNALDYYQIMDTEKDVHFDRLTQLASEICDTPISLVSLVDGERQWFKSRVGLEAQQTPRDISFCQHAIMDVKTFEVENAVEDERFANNVLVTGDPNIRFYAGHPLTDKNGYNLGTLCVIDREPKKLTDHQRKALKLLAEEVVSQIEHHKKRKDLESYRKFFDLSLDYMCIAGTDGYFKSLNPTFAKELGYTEEELLSKPFVDFIHEDDVESTIMEVHKLSKGYKTVGFVNRYKKKDGGYIHMHWTCHPDPLTGELFATAHDITALTVAKNDLEKSNEELDQFAYIVSHDLKAPLRAISTLSNFLEEDLEGKLDGETQENFDLLRNRVGRMETLINGILEYSRVGRKDASKEDIHTKNFLIELKESCDLPDGFRIEIPEKLPIVSYSRIQLTQIFQNLINNAVKYHDKEEGLIMIRYVLMHDKHKFDVIDDGPGIDKNYHDKIFGIFQTLQSRDEIESTGIGLSIVKKIIEDNGGEIWVSSELGEGSTFSFTIPA